MIVEGLAPDPRRPGSTRVLVGGRPAWTVPADVVATLALAAGSRIGAAELDVLERAADEEGAFRAGLRALERRAHATQELRAKLVRKGHDQRAIDGCIARLERLGLLDDLAFARQYVASRGDRGRGPVRLRRDLGALGVVRAIIDTVLAEAAQGADDPTARVRALAARRAAQLRDLPPDARRRRLAAFLARRGFAGSDARSIVDGLVGRERG